MGRGIDYQRFAVLFVDDEEPTLRLFDKFFSRTLRVFTAPSVDEAALVLEEHGDEIGVLITDQRMPGRRGVELLDLVRERFPDMVRILTTGYSDIQEAIDAVNRGEIFRYISKPWNAEALRDELMHALELFTLRRERALFLDEKLSVRQRQTQSERLRDLVAMSGALPGLRHPLHGLRALLGQLIELAPSPPTAGEAADWTELDHWGLIHRESRAMHELGRHLAHMVGGGGELDGAVEPLALLRAALQTPLGRAVQAHLPDTLPALRGDRQLLERLLALLLTEIERLHGDAPVELTAAPAGDGVRITFTLTGGRPTPATGTLLTSPPGADALHLPLHGDLFAAFLIAHHHGGTVELTATDEGLTVALELPSDPRTVDRPPLEEEWMEEILVRLEGWD